MCRPAAASDSSPAPMEQAKVDTEFSCCLMKFAVGKRKRPAAERYHFFYTLYPVPTAPRQEDDEE